MTVVLPAGPGDRTELIQAALNAAGSFRRVVLGPGRHICGGLRLGSNTELHLSKGARLWFQTRYAAFAQTSVSVIAEDSDRAMIVAAGAENIALTGQGVIFGGGSHYHLGNDASMGTLLPFEQRPRVVVLEGCDSVRIEGVRVEQSPMWTVHLVDCERVAIRQLSVKNDRRMPNTDGLVIDGCRDVLVEESDISTADDGIVLKTSARGGGTTGPCERIAVRDCTVESRSCALKLGSESFADFRDINFEDCRISASNRALGIFSRDGGVIERVRFRRIVLDCRETPDGFWGSGEALTVNMLDRRPSGRPAGTIHDVVLEDVSGRMEGAINLYAERPGGISKVALNRVAIAQEPGPLGTAQRYDLRPSPADLSAVPGAEGRRNAWRKGSDGQVIGLERYPGGLPGIFARGLHGLSFKDVDILRPAALPEGWNREAVVLVDCTDAKAADGTDLTDT